MRKLTAYIFIIVAGLFLFAATSRAAEATTYYVSPGGSDSSTGTTASPFRTIQKGINVAQPGDTVIVKPGTYTGQNATYGHAEFNPNTGRGRSGTGTARITLKAENPAADTADSTLRTIIKGSGSGFGIYVNGLNYITIEGFEIYNWEGGIGLQGQTNNLILRKNILRSNTAAGIECASCSNNLFEYNQFLDPGPPYPELADAIQDYGLNFYQGSANNTVTHNYFFGKHNQALSFKRKAGPGLVAYNTFEGCMYTCLYLGQNDDEAGSDMTSYDVTVEYNIFRDAADNGFGNYAGAANGTYYRMRTPITIRNIQNATVRGNFVENALQSPIYVVGCEGGYYCQTHTGKQSVGAKIYGNTFANTKNYEAFEITGRGYSPDTIEIYNNTIFGANPAMTIGTFPLSDSVPSKSPPNLIIKNNNFVNTGTGASGNLSTSTFAYNNWYPNNTKQSLADFNTDPKFTGAFTTFDPSTNRGPNPVYTPDTSRFQTLKLALGSPLIDMGINVGLTFQGNAPDIGSNEFIESTSTSPTPTPTPITISPSPTPTGSYTQPCPTPGDTKQNGVCDGAVNDSDVIYLTGKFGATDLSADLKPDGAVNILDYVVLMNGYSTSTTPSPTPTPTATSSSNLYPYPKGGEPPIGWTSCDTVEQNTADTPCVKDGWTAIHPGYWGSMSGPAGDQWANTAISLGISKKFFNNTPWDLMRNIAAGSIYTEWVKFFQQATTTSGKGVIAGYYLPDEPETYEYGKILDIVRALRAVDPNALGLVYDGGVNPGTLSTILGRPNGVDVLLDGGYPYYHPEYGGHGWVYARLREIEPTVKKTGDKNKDTSLWITAEGFGGACTNNGIKRIKSTIAMAITGGAQGVMTYAYNEAAGTDCYKGQLEFLPLFKALWPWTGNNTSGSTAKYLPVTVTSGPAKSPLYNLSIATSYPSVQAVKLNDNTGKTLVASVNLYDNQSVGASIGNVPNGIYEVWDAVSDTVKAVRTVTVTNNTITDNWPPFGYYFYILTN